MPLVAGGAKEFAGVRRVLAWGTRRMEATGLSRSISGGFQGSKFHIAKRREEEPKRLTRRSQTVDDNKSEENGHF
jgi:hypothetical protein